jgi:hypothetical protein
MKLIKRFFKDLKKGQNIPLLLTIIVNIALIIMRMFHLVTDIDINVAILGTLIVFLSYTYAIKVISSDLNDKITGYNLDYHINSWNKYNLEGTIKNSKKSIQILNRVGFNAMNSNFGEIKNALNRNCDVQIIIGDLNVAKIQANWTDGTKTEDDYKRDHERCLELFVRLKNEKSSGKIEIKTIPVSFSYSAIIIDQASDNAEYTIAPYSFPTISDYGWQITSNKKESQNLSKYLAKDFTLAWSKGTLVD